MYIHDLPSISFRKWRHNLSIPRKEMIFILEYSIDVSGSRTHDCTAFYKFSGRMTPNRFFPLIINRRPSSSPAFCRLIVSIKCPYLISTAFCLLIVSINCPNLVSRTFCLLIVNIKCKILLSFDSKYWHPVVWWEFWPQILMWYITCNLCNSECYDKIYY